MKKVLLGLLAVSAVSMAAAPDLNGPATEGGNVFQSNQQGAISVTGTVTSQVPVVKYVVFASENGVDMKDTLNLKEFIFTQTKEATGTGFQGNNDKIYVKRVENGQLSSLTTADNIEFKLNPNNDFVYYNPQNQKWVSLGESVSVYPTQLMAKGDLQTIVSTIPNGIMSLDGKIIFSEGGQAQGRDTIVAGQLEKGEFEIRSVVASIDELDKLTTEQKAAVNNAFAGGKAINGLNILVKLK